MTEVVKPNLYERKIDVFVKRLDNIKEIKGNLEDLLKQLKDHELGCEKDFGDFNLNLEQANVDTDNIDVDLKRKQREIEKEIKREKNKPIDTIVEEEDIPDIKPIPKPIILKPENDKKINPPKCPTLRTRIIPKNTNKEKLKFKRREYSLPTQNNNKNGLDDILEFDDEELSSSEENDIVPELPTSETIREQKESEEKKKQIESESVTNLLALNKKDIKNKEALKKLGYPKECKLPNNPQLKKKLDRDLRKLDNCMKDVSDPEDRKLLKLAVIKHHDILYKTFVKYCKIGGDKGWMSRDGWLQMNRDSYIMEMKGETDKKFINQLFEDTFCYYNPDNPKQQEKKRVRKVKKQNSKRFSFFQKQQTISNFGDLQDEDPWTGTWVLQLKDDNKQGAKEIFKLKQIGDTKIVGCIKHFNFCEIDGYLDPTDHGKAKLVIKWKEGPRRNTKRRLVCTFLPPKNLLGMPQMDVSWIALGEFSVNEAKGKEKWEKDNTIKDGNFEDGLPKTKGIGRHEFLDCMITLAVQKYGNNKQKARKWELLLKLIDENLYKFIWSDDVKPLKDIDKKRILKKGKTEIVQLFHKYSAFDDREESTDDGLGLDEFVVFVKDILYYPNRDKKFKKGGKPDLNTIRSIFNLVKIKVYEDEILLKEFENSLELLALATFKIHPGKQKYYTPSKTERFRDVIDWCIKLKKENKKLDFKQLRKIQDKLEDNNSNGLSTVNLLSPRNQKDTKTPRKKSNDN